MAHSEAAVAVITRTKDRPLLLDRAVRSVMQQSARDLHHVVVNDGGDPDAVEQVVARRKDVIGDRLTVVHHPVSKGMEAATNAGIAASSSTYVAILDDDDTWHPRFLEATIDAMRRSGRPGAVTATEIILEEVDETGIRTVGSTPFVTDTHLIRGVRHSGNVAEWPYEDRGERVDVLRANRGPRTSLFAMLEGNQFTSNAFVYARSALAEVGLYDESLPVLGDWDFNVRFLRRFDVERIDRPLAYYHHRVGRSDQLTNTVNDPERSHDRVREQLLNRYLRGDLASGALGLGTLANLLHEAKSTAAFDHAAYDDLRDDLASVAASAESASGSVAGELDVLGWRLGEVDRHVSRAEDIVLHESSAATLERRLRTVARSVPRRAVRRGLRGLTRRPVPGPDGDDR
ncbi:MAG: glycosyltransferase family 2 protein [Acidimicrobiales bacterium]